jgi:hypothetical protein
VTVTIELELPEPKVCEARCRSMLRVGLLDAVTPEVLVSSGAAV